MSDSETRSMSGSPEQAYGSDSVASLFSSINSDDENSPTSISGENSLFGTNTGYRNITASEDELCGKLNDSALLRRQRAEYSYDHSDCVSNESYRSHQSNYDSGSDFRSFGSSPDPTSPTRRQLYPLDDPREQRKKDILTRKKLRADQPRQRKYSKEFREFERLENEPNQELKYRRKHRVVKERVSSESELTDLINSYFDKYRDMCKMCLAVIALLVVIYFLYPMVVSRFNDDPMHNVSFEKSKRNDIITKFVDEFKVFAAKFTQQSSLTLLTIKAASKSVMRDYNPVKPGVILLTGNNNAVETISCMATQIATITSQAYSSQFVEVKEADLKAYRDYHGVKKYLEDVLRSALSSGKVVVIHDLHKIDGRAAMIFHAFCDNENAPYKDSVIIFTVTIDTDDAITDEEQVEDYLNSVWESQLELDSRSPLMTRIANFVAIVEPEPKSTLHKHCQGN